MQIFLRPGEQVEVQFVVEGSTQQATGVKIFDQALVIKHSASRALAGTVDPEGRFVQAFQVALTNKD